MKHEPASRNLPLPAKACVRLCAAAIALVAPMVAAAPGNWWDEAWSCRKQIQVNALNDGLPDPAAVAVFTTCGEMDRDAADLRVIASDGSEMPHYVIASGFEDLCTVAFPVKEGDYAYHLYFGNADARRPKYDWTPKRGLMLEVRTKGKGSFNNWKQMEELIRNSPNVQGRGLHPAVFDGHNRFGPSDNYISIYTGYLYCPSAGTYDFATTSDEASFLFVDKKLAVQWPGGHGAVADARHHNEVELKRGVHFFQYFHVEGGGGQVAEAAWKLPNQDAFAVIPAQAFVPFWPAGVVKYEQRDDPAPLDFEFWQESSLPVGDGIMSAMRFQTTSPSTARQGAQSWDFGDGVSSTTRNPRHIYTKPGKYRVSLRVGNKSLMQTVRVWDNERVSPDEPDAVAGTYANAFGAYDLASVNEETLVAIIEFAVENKVYKLQNEALAALSGNVGSYTSLTAGNCLLAYAETLRIAGNLEQALALLDALATRHSKNEIVCAALHRQGQLLMALGEGEKAGAAFNDLKDLAGRQTDYHTVALRDMGDYFRFEGDIRRAREQYEEAESAAASGLPKDVIPNIVRGGYSQATLEYLRRGEYEAALQQVDQWEQTFPTDKLEGYLSVVKAIALMNLGEVGLAYAEVRDLFTVNPESNFAAAALLLQGDCLSLLKQTDDAKARYQRVIDEYPESPMRAAAERRLLAPPQTLRGLPFPVIHF